jgi:hypothetical protein
MYLEGFVEEHLEGLSPFNGLLNAGGDSKQDLNEICLADR